MIIILSIVKKATINKSGKIIKNHSLDYDIYLKNKKKYKKINCFFR